MLLVTVDIFKAELFFKLKPKSCSSSELCLNNAKILSGNDDTST